MTQNKEKWEHVTKSSRIEWVVTRDNDQTIIRSATFYILEPQYHAHPWTAGAVFVAKHGGSMMNTNKFGQLDPPQTEALVKALQMASRWAQGRKIAGAKKIRE